MNRLISSTIQDVEGVAMCIHGGYELCGILLGSLHLAHVGIEILIGGSTGLLYLGIEEKHGTVDTRRLLAVQTKGVLIAVALEEIFLGLVCTIVVGFYLSSGPVFLLAVSNKLTGRVRICITVGDSGVIIVGVHGPVDTGGHWFTGLDRILKRATALQPAAVEGLVGTSLGEPVDVNVLEGIGCLVDSGYAPCKGLDIPEGIA